MTTWAKFFYYAGKWHFHGFTSHEAAVGEFEEFCATENVVSVVLALQHPPPRQDARLIRPEPPAGRRIQKVQTAGERLLSNDPEPVPAGAGFLCLRASAARRPGTAAARA